MLRLEARPEPSRVAGWLSPLLAAAATVVVGFILFTALGKNPWFAFHAFFVKPLTTQYGIGELTHTLLQHGLIDEIRLLMYPVVISGGHIFETIDKTPLKLLETKTFSNGVLVLHYQPTN